MLIKCRFLFDFPSREPANVHNMEATGGQEEMTIEAEKHPAEVHLINPKAFYRSLDFNDFFIDFIEFI